MSNPAIELERGDGPLERPAPDRTRLLTIAAWSFAVWAAVFVIFAGARSVNETQEELRLIPWLPYDDRVDFGYFYAAASMIWNGDADELYPLKYDYIFYPGDPVFDAETDEYLFDRMLARGNYYNPPLVAILQSPLASLDFRLAFWVFSGISIASFCGLLAAYWWSGRSVPEMPLVVLGMAAFQPIHEAVIMGHLSLFFAASLGIGFLALRSKQPVLAGLVFSLLALKPQWAILPGLFLLWRGEWRALGTMTIASAALFFVPFLAVGGAETFDRYQQFIRGQSQADLLNAPHMFSWNGFLSKLAPNDPFALPIPDIDKPVFYALEAVTVFVVLLIWSGRDYYLGVAATIIGMLLLSTHSVWYDWAFMVVAVMFLILRPGSFFVRAQIWLLVLALFVAAGSSVDAIFDPDGRHGFLHWSEPAYFSITLVAFGTLIWCAGRVILEGSLSLPRFRRAAAEAISA